MSRADGAGEGRTGGSRTAPGFGNMMEQFVGSSAFYRRCIFHPGP